MRVLNDMSFVGKAGDGRDRGMKRNTNDEKNGSQEHQGLWKQEYTVREGGEGRRTRI